MSKVKWIGVNVSKMAEMILVMIPTFSYIAFIKLKRNPFSTISVDQ